MGSGIAQVAASNGCKVNLIDTFPNALENSQTKLQSILNRLVEKGKIEENEAKSILAKFQEKTLNIKMDKIINKREGNQLSSFICILYDHFFL